MTKQGVFYFVGQLNPHTEKLKTHLKRNGYYCYGSDNHDEIDQAGRQRGKAVLIFSNARFALDFLKKNSWSAFATYYALVPEKDGTFKPEAKSALESQKLNLFMPKELQKCLNECKDFLKSGMSKEDVEIENLEFNVNNKK